jgi:transposase
MSHLKIQRIAGKWSTLFVSASGGTMKAYSTDFREKIVKAYEQGNTSVRKIASRFDVSKILVQRLLEMKKTQGHVEPRKQGGGMKSELYGYEAQLAEMVKKYPDATLSEYCEYWGENHNQWVSSSTMCRALQKQQLTLKKRHYAALRRQRKEFKS